MKYLIMKKWTKALRSGEYKQTRGKLRDKDGFCCLGVLCDISKIQRWGFNKDQMYSYGKLNAVAGKVGKIIAVATLPAKVVKWSGIRDAAGHVKGKNLSLASLNDSGIPLNKIADLIEENYKML